MNIRFRNTLFFIFFAIVTISLLWRKTTLVDVDENSLMIGSNYCIDKESIKEIVEGPSTSRQRFVSCCLVDSSRHYYRNTIILEPADTFFVSIFSGLNIALLTERSNLVGQSIHARKILPDSETWYLERNQHFISRLILPDKKLNQIILFDYASADSSIVYNYFKDNPISLLLKQCAY